MRCFQDVKLPKTSQENERVLSAALQENSSIKDSQGPSQGTPTTQRMSMSLLKLPSMIDLKKETGPIATCARTLIVKSIAMKAISMIRRITTTLDHLRTDKAQLVLTHASRKLTSKILHPGDRSGPKAAAATRTLAALTTATLTSSIAPSHHASLAHPSFRTKITRLTCHLMTFPFVALLLSDLSSGNLSKHLEVKLPPQQRSHSTLSRTETRRL